jgi:hypothetical protein
MALGTIAEGSLHTRSRRDDLPSSNAKLSEWNRSRATGLRISRRTQIGMRASPYDLRTRSCASVCPRGRTGRDDRERREHGAGDHPPGKANSESVPWVLQSRHSLPAAQLQVTQMIRRADYLRIASTSPLIYRQSEHD